MPSTRRLAVFVSSAALFGAAGGAGVTAVRADDPAARTVTVTAPAATASAATAAAEDVSATSGTALTPAQVYARSKGSVVYISATTPQGEATGSGFVISSDGYIVTNAHVVSDATKVQVKVGGGTEQTARVVGIDESTDVALLDVDATGLPALQLGDSDGVQVGDGSYAIGNPFGLDRTLTTGVVSALHREISSPNGYSISDVLQTDAALNPGNSGGPLLDVTGKVIGVNSQIETSGSSEASAGVGFAVPANTVKRVVEQLEADGTATHAYLGVSTSDAGTGSGVTVGAVKAGGPAADAGLAEGDVITKIGDVAIADAGDVAAQVDAHKPGDAVAVTVVRDGATKTFRLTLGTRPA